MHGGKNGWAKAKMSLLRRLWKPSARSNCFITISFCIGCFRFPLLPFSLFNRVQKTCAIFILSGKTAKLASLLKTVHTSSICEDENTFNAIYFGTSISSSWIVFNHHDLEVPILSVGVPHSPPIDVNNAPTRRADEPLRRKSIQSVFMNLWRQAQQCSHCKCH